MHVADDSPKKKLELIFDPNASLAKVVSLVKPISKEGYFSTIV